MEKRQRKKIGAAIMLLGFLVFVVWKKEDGRRVLTETGELYRREVGEGEYEAQLMLEIDGTQETEFIITVPEQRLTSKEEEAFLLAAIEELEQEFAGTNLSLEEVRSAVEIRENYQEGRVQAQWQFSNHKLVEPNGDINEDALEENAEVVEAKVFLTCEDSSLIHEFGFVVCKREKGEEEIFFEKLNQFISQDGKREGEEVLRLPASMEGHSLDWTEQKSKLPTQILLIGIVIILLIPMVEKEREKERQKQRENQLEREYPQVVNKLALLLGAGMTLQSAWRQITVKYIEGQAQKQQKIGIVYEEMLITQREMESGVGEGRAYEAFGERCGLPRYRKLSSYLVQNIKKGNHAICELLEREVSDTFAERKNTAQRYGEEVGTKLLFPMLIMLALVIVIIMIPAVLSFQAGTS